MALTGWHHQDVSFAQDLLRTVHRHAHGSLHHEKGFMLLAVVVRGTRLPIGHKQELAAVAVRLLVRHPELDLADLVKAAQAKIQHQRLAGRHRQPPTAEHSPTGGQCLCPRLTDYLEGKIRSGIHAPPQQVPANIVAP
ncbi:MAG: hypothetical protein MUC51_02455 [Anaerolineae bacterium]|nr:hypothetical protein [Anaerolineae bacterium]